VFSRWCRVVHRRRDTSSPGRSPADRVASPAPRIPAHRARVATPTIAATASSARACARGSGTWQTGACPTTLGPASQC
jgi:hypothetical protein